MFDFIRVPFTLSTLDRIANDPIFPRATKQAAARLFTSIEAGELGPRSAGVPEFIADCRKLAERDIFETPLPQLAWAERGERSATLDSYARPFMAWSGLYPCIDEYSAGVIGAMADGNPLTMIRKLRGLED